ncbi:MAG: ribose 5-phosphate isomerase B [Candidatus Oleimicrobiaceae bacterium]
MKRLLTESDVRKAKKERVAEITVDEHTIVMPSALDAARGLGISLRWERRGFAKLVGEDVAKSVSKRDSSVSLGSDHAGYRLKEHLKALLAQRGHLVIDRGAFSEAPVDYPDIALQVAQDVSQRRAGRGIIVDGAGIGSAIVANKLPGVRAANCCSVAAAKSSREHNDANILTLGAAMVDTTTATQIVEVWLNTDFAGGRHERRVKKILKVERRYLRG